MARGSIRQRSPGSYELRVYTGQLADGRPHQKTETVRGTRRDADRRLRELLNEIDRGAHHNTDHTFSQLIAAWLDAHPPTQGSPLTHINCYLRPELGHIRLSRLDPAAIDRLYGQLRRKGVRGHPLADSSIRRIHTTLNVILSQGVKWGWLPRNPAEAASPPVGRRKPPVPPDVNQVKQLLEEAARTNPPLHAYLRVAAACGPRRGELAGVRRSDVDYRTGEIVFRRSVVFDENGRVAVKPYTKTGGQRRVALDEATIVALKVLEMEQGEQAARFAVELDPDPWLFSFDIKADQPPRPDAFTRAFGRVRDRLNLKVRLHDLRHYHATSLLTAGVDVRTVAGRLGHANPAVTLSVYAAWQPAADRKASDIAAGLLD